MKNYFNPSIFKAYDIRGVFEKDFSADFAYYLALSYLDFIKQKKKKNNNLTIVVAQDMRLSSPSISKELIKGLRVGGANVLDIGLAATPTFYFAVSFLKADGGLIISASHNPKEWNGFKVVLDKAKPVALNSGLDWIRDSLETINDKKREDLMGTYTKVKDILNKQLEHDLNFIDINYNKIKPFIIAADAANSMGAPYLAALAKRLPIKLKKLNFTLDGSFPAHEADPIKEENLVELKNYIKNNSIDFGITTDGDGDRVFFLDEKGELISPAIIRGILAKLFLKDKPKSKIAYDIRPGKITEDLIIKNGGKPVITKVGHSLIKKQMLTENIYFAGESSGHFFLNLDIGCFEMPIIIITKLLIELSQSNLKASQYFAPYNKYFHSGEINRLVADKEKTIKKIANYYKKGELNYLDGVSVKFSNFWFNVRGSNTENKLRLNLEASDKKIMEEKTKEVLGLMID